MNKYALRSLIRHSMIGSPERVEIQRSYIYIQHQKLGRFIAAFGSFRSRTLKTVNFGQKMPLNGPNFAISEFSQHRVWFSERRPPDQLLYRKLGRFIVPFGSYRPKTLKLALNGQNFAIYMA